MQPEIRSGQEGPSQSDSGQSPSRRDGRHVAGVIFKWLGRLAAVGLFFLWGAFFVEHINQWYLDRTHPGLPPWWVWVAMAAHAAILVGMLMMLRWEAAGMVTVLVGTIGFMVCAACGGKVAWIMLYNLVPLALIGASWCVRPRGGVA